MSAFESFMTGFLGRKADIISQRKDKAEDYFDTRLERARTIGTQNIQQRREQANGMLTLSRSLMEDANVPEHVVRVLANEGPQALEEAHRIHMENVSKGISTDADWWERTYNFSQEVIQDSNMSLSDFLHQVVGLYPSNLQATTREGGDPFGAFVASGLGLNAMDRARDRLGEWEVAEGFSAADILDLEGRPQNTRPMGDTGYAGPRYSFVSDTWAENAPLNPLTESEWARYISEWDKRREREAEILYSRVLNDRETRGESLEGLRVEDFMEEASFKVAEDMAKLFPFESISQIPEIMRYLQQQETDENVYDFTGDDPDEITTTVLPPSTEEGVNSRPSVVQPGDQLTDNNTGQTFTITDQTEDGVVVQDELGQEQVLPVDEIIQGLESGGMGYVNVPTEQPVDPSPHLTNPDMPEPGQVVIFQEGDTQKEYQFFRYVDGQMVFFDPETQDYFVVSQSEYNSLYENQMLFPTSRGMLSTTLPSTGPQIQDDW